LNYVSNHNLLVRSSYVLIPKELSTEDFKQAKKKFQKQLTVYQLLDQEDYQKYQLTYGPNGLTVPMRGGKKKTAVVRDGDESEVKEAERDGSGSVEATKQDYPSTISQATETLRLTNYQDLLQYLYHNMLANHLDSKLYVLLQELILVPLGTPYGDIFWNVLLSYCQSMRSARQLITEMSATLITSLSKTELLSEINKYLINDLSLDQCFQEIVNIETSTEGKQAHQMRQLVKALYSKDAEIVRLKDEIVLVKSASGQWSLSSIHHS
jgi:hypothetical protein